MPTYAIMHFAGKCRITNPGEITCIETTTSLPDTSAAATSLATQLTSKSKTPTFSECNMKRFHPQMSKVGLKHTERQKGDPKSTVKFGAKHDFYS